MDLSVQDWLIAIGALLIVGVLLDAYRRYRNERRNPIRLGKASIGMGGGFPRDEAETGNSELPGGGARVVRQRDAQPGSSPSVPARAAERLEPRIDSTPAPVPPEPALFPEPVLVAEPRHAGIPRQSLATDATAEEVLVIHVLARAPGGFAGRELLEILKLCDVRFGQQRIFHRTEEEKGQGAVQFSIANSVEPGVFDPDAMETFSTPGLSFFMQLPGPQKPLEAFDCMLETARSIAKNLDGELRDDSHSVFTPQTVEHCRQRVRDFVHRARRRR
ncbi:MAG: cell division protein ZipA [Gammaproteobacteria bacterium]|mgnify:CR=1 FL=1|jgi:cell division protein ZipA|nr:cell division protein ZipA [Gammaproteobacteria bacterium]MBK6582244.1 cell division protein ZipA [Gammaproteobacteria bacterium]MBK7171350.1 cell division protein ZipA [Gammaproteobacteria bacterium]MBK7521483.1 cell division protein ZipA [Gammaproteobacteria bacterium]MBK7729260.1 cell division protein ZipA [Gammaproteobacteria bacterium]